MDYRGQHCPICGKEFCDGDDIVVCPECGTPYHRECYKTAGHCVNEERHGENFEWKPETAPHAKEKTRMSVKMQTMTVTRWFFARCAAERIRRRSRTALIAEQGSITIKTAARRLFRPLSFRIWINSRSAR